MAPLLANLLSITDDLPPDLAMLDPVMRKQQMLAMLAELLSELSRRRPVLLLIEDAHWIDPSTHDLFRQIARAVHDSAILMLVNLRPERDAMEQLSGRNAPAAQRPRPSLGHAARRSDCRQHVDHDRR